MEELSGQIEVEVLKHSPESDQSQQNNDPMKESQIKSVRVVGMDEGTKSKGAWIQRAFALGEGPPKTSFKLEGALGSLVLDEGKSQYLANPFWATITEVCNSSGLENPY